MWNSKADYCVNMGLIIKLYKFTLLHRSDGHVCQSLSPLDMLTMDWSNILRPMAPMKDGMMTLMISHAKATVTCYGTRRSSKASGNVVLDKKNNITDQQTKVYTE